LSKFAVYIINNHIEISYRDRDYLNTEGINLPKSLDGTLFELTMTAADSVSEDATI
jgi:hypothetical protein